MADEKTKLKKYWAEQAVSLALQGRWAEAVTANQNILALFPSDAEAYNRLGKAYTELGKYTEAKECYAHALQIDPGNSIAEKNLQRLTSLVAAGHVEVPPPLVEGRLEPRLFIDEMGKTGITTLINTADQPVLAKLSAGDPVQLRIENKTLVVESIRGERIGEVEPKLGHRLIKFMQAGNRYTAAISSLENSVRIIIHETYQDPSQVGRVSFPGKVGDMSFRSYIKDSVLKYDLDEDEEEVLDEEVAGLDTEAAGDEVVEEAEGFEDELSNGVPDDK